MLVAKWPFLESNVCKFKFWLLYHIRAFPGMLNRLEFHLWYKTRINFSLLSQHVLIWTESQFSSWLSNQCSPEILYGCILRLTSFVCVVSIIGQTILGLMLHNFLYTLERLCMGGCFIITVLCGIMIVRHANAFNDNY